MSSDGFGNPRPRARSTPSQETFPRPDQPVVTALLLTHSVHGHHAYRWLTPPVIL